MPEHEQQKRVCYRRIECPHCGNEITAKNIDDDQKCPFCKRKYKVKCTKRGKKYHWEAIAIDYSYEAEGRHNVGIRLEHKRYGYNKR